MEKRKNLYKLDDFCLILSVILFIVFLVQFRSLISLFAGSDLTPLIDGAKNLVLTSPLRMGSLLFSAVFFQIIGRVVRKKEKISLEVIEAISYRSRASVSTLAAELGREQASLEKIIKQLAAIPGAGVTFDGKYVKIDRGEPDYSASKFDRNFDTTAAQDSPSPSYDTGASKDSGSEVETSGTDFTGAESTGTDSQETGLDSDGYPKGFPEELKKAGVKPSHIKPELRGMLQSAEYKNKSGQLRPNPILLIFLLIAFWPAAVIYLVSFYIKNAQKNAIRNGIEKK